MNFIITSDCNKGCPYCFAAQARKRVAKDDREMSLGTFLEYLQKLPINNDGPNPMVKLLGGEPTQHSEFPKFVDAVLEQRRPVTIISNFLFDEDTRNFLVRRVNEGHDIGFLVNATDLDVRDRIETWKKNYMALYSAFYRFDQEDKISIGYTLEHRRDAQYYIDYTKFLVENIKLIERLRLSLPFPSSDKDRNKFEFINNKELGNKFLKIAKTAIDFGIKPSIDCVIYPCMFETKEHFKFLLKFSDAVRTVCGQGAPSDIFKDGTMSYCYPLKEIIKVDTTKYDTLHQATEDMILRYQAIQAKIEEDLLPNECRVCPFKASGECRGPCLGSYDLKGETIGINV